jgi:hypothetical protein
MMGLVIDLVEWLRRGSAINRAALREEMTENDPDFARVRDVQHDAMQALAAKRAADGLAIRQERKFWEQAHH